MENLAQWKGKGGVQNLRDNAIRSLCTIAINIEERCLKIVLGRHGGRDGLCTGDCLGWTISCINRGMAKGYPEDYSTLCRVIIRDGACLPRVSARDGMERVEGRPKMVLMPAM